MTRSIRFAILFAIVALISACDDLPNPDDFAAGMTRQELISSFGEPLERQALIKAAQPVFGPIETFWSDLPLGTIVEIWHYSAEGGTAEVYFTDNAMAVSGVGFAPEGVVY